jgi:uncharacterized membrane protein YfcA
MELEYAGYALWCFAIAVAGGLVGLVLGNLRLPAGIALASSPAAAAGANIGISAVAAASAAVTHVRAGRINWTLFAWMAPPSVVGALIGGYVAEIVPGDLLLVTVAVVLLYSAVDLWGWTPPQRDAAAAHALRLHAAVVLGFVIGLLGGFVGLILGSLRMPAMLRIIGERPAAAVGTNVTVGFCLGVAGVIGHLPAGAPDWGLLAIGGAASIPGAALGARLTGRLSEHELVRAVAAILVVAAVAIVISALT